MEDEGKQEEKYEFSREGEVFGSISLDQARVLAMRTARERPGAYGWRLRRVPMVFEVVEETETEDHYVITLAFRPEGAFAGTPGREQVFIEKEGTVALRQVLSIPGGGGWRRIPLGLIAVGLVAVVAVAVGGVMAATGGGGGNDDLAPQAASLPASTPEPPTSTPVPDPTTAPAAVPPVVATATPTPTPTPTPAPTPTAALLVLVPTPTPLPVATPTPAPTPKPIPSPTLDPTAVLAVAPTSTPRPAATPLPTPTPLPAPTATLVVPTPTASVLVGGMTRGGTISGTVTDEDTGLPIAGVGINANSLGPGPGQSSLTTAEGAYTLAGLDPGSYRILPSCGTGDYIPEMYDDSLDWSRVDPVAVGVGEAVSGVDLALRKGANISGKVTDAQSGLPVGGIQVDAGPSEWKFLVATDTDGNGDYTLRGLPEGQITVIVARHGGVDYISQERTVGITGTQEVLGTDFELTLGTTISGRVTDADTGLPIANYRIELRSVLDNETSKFNTRTDSDGRYTIPGVAPGTYRIESCCDGEQYIREYYDNALIEGNADLVTIDGSEPVEGIDFTPKLGGTISGRVVDGASGLGIQGMNVTTLLPDNSQLTTTLTDSNGEYTLWGVPDGNIVVAVDGKGYVEQRQTVTVQDGEDLTGVDF